MQNTFYLKPPYLFFKTRYTNILPYDFNRVKLKVPANDVDYINASYITRNASGTLGTLVQEDLDTNIGEDPANPARWSNINFIACQGPLPGTATHHLEMISENKIDIVVMLTRVQEKNKSK